MSDGDVIRELVVSLSMDSGNFSKDIQGTANAVKQADAKFKALGAGVKDFEKSAAGMQAKVTMLTEKLNAQNSAVSKYQAALDKSRDKVQKAADKQTLLATRIDAAKAAYAAQAAATGKDSVEAKALAEELTKLEGQFTANGKSAQRAAQDVQKNETALLNAQAAVKATGAELQKVNRELELHGSAWSQAMEKVSAATGAFGKKATDYGKKMTMGVTVPVVAAGAAAYKAWETVDDGMDIVIRKTGATGDALKPLEDVYNRIFTGMKVTAEDTGIAVGEVNTRFHATGQQLQDLSTLFIQFADVNEADLNGSIGNTQKILSQWSLGAESAKGFLGLLTSESQRTGVAVDTLFDSIQTNGATMKGMGLNLSQSVQLLANFEAAGVNADTALTALKKSAGTYAKDGKSLEAGLNGTINAIKNAKTETEALAIAQKVFGAKGALEMATAIREGRLSIAGLSADMSQMGSVVSKTFNEINGDTPILDRVKNKLVSTGAQFGKAMIPWVEQAADKVGQLVDSFAEMSPASQKTIIGIAGVAAATGPALSAIGKMATGVGAMAKLFTGPVGWITLAVGALVGLGIAINSVNNIPIKVKVNDDDVNKLKSSMDEGKAAAQKTAEIIAGVSADADALKEKVDGALSDRDITKKEFTAISKFVNEKVNPDIEAAKLALDTKVAEFKISLDNAVDAQGNPLTDEQKNTLLAEFEAKNSKLISDIEQAKTDYSNLLTSLQKQSSPITDAQIAQLNEQAGKLFSLTEQLRIAMDTVAAAGKANYNLTVSGRGNEQSIGAAIGYVQGEQQIATDNAQKKLNTDLGLAGDNADQAAKAYEDYNKELNAIEGNADKGYQAILDGVAKMAGASTTLETLTQDYDAFAETLQTLSDTGINFDQNGGWIDKFKILFGPDGELGKYLSSDQKLTLDKKLVPENANSYYAYKAVRDVVQDLQYQIAGALHDNMNDPTLNPVFTAYQTMLDSGAFKNLDLTKLNGALEGVIKTNDIERLMNEHGQNAVGGLASGINDGTSTAVNAVHDMFAAAIAEANRMRPLLQNALYWTVGPGSKSGQGGGYGGYGGGNVNAQGSTSTTSASKNYTANANMQIENYNVYTQTDADSLMAQQAAKIRRIQSGYGFMPTRNI